MSVESVDAISDTDRESMSDGTNSNDNNGDSNSNIRDNNRNNDNKGLNKNASTSHRKRHNSSTPIEPKRTCTIATRYLGVRSGSGVEGDGQQTTPIYWEQPVEYRNSVSKIRKDSENGNSSSSDDIRGRSSNSNNNGSGHGITQEIRRQDAYLNDVVIIEIDSDNDDDSKNYSNDNNENEHIDYEDYRASYNPLIVYESTD